MSAVPRSQRRRTIEERREIDKLRQRRFRAKKKAMEVLLNMGTDEKIMESPDLVLELAKPVPENLQNNPSEEINRDEAIQSTTSLPTLKNFFRTVNPKGEDVNNWTRAFSSAVANGDISIRRVTTKKPEISIEEKREKERIRKRRERARKKAAKLLNVLSRETEIEEPSEQIDAQQDSATNYDNDDDSLNMTNPTGEQSNSREGDDDDGYQDSMTSSSSNEGSCTPGNQHDPTEEQHHVEKIPKRDKEPSNPHLPHTHIHPDDFKPCTPGLTPIPKWNMQVNLDREKRLLAHRIYNKRYRERMKAQQIVEADLDAKLNCDSDKRRGMSIEERREKDRIRKRLSRERMKQNRGKIEDEEECEDKRVTQVLEEEELANIPVEVWKCVLENIEQMREQTTMDG